MLMRLSFPSSLLYSNVFVFLFALLCGGIEGIANAGQMHQQRRSSSLEELIQRRNTRSFPYSAVSYLRMLQPNNPLAIGTQPAINPQLIFSPSSTNSQLSQMRANSQKQRLLLGSQPEISELIDLLDSLEDENRSDHQQQREEEEEEEEGGAIGAYPMKHVVEDRERKVQRRSAGPVLKRYACRFKFCRIFDV